jgi:exosortase
MSSPITQDVPAGRSTTVDGRFKQHPGLYWAILGVSVALIFANFWHSFVDIYHNWRLPDSLYSHALIIPPISLFFAWRLRREVLAAPYVSGTWLGFTCLLGGCLLLLLGDFLGFMTLVHIALLPVLTGICLIVLGLRATAILWFPLAFIFFMFPMPYSIISVISFQSKIFATEAAVALGKACTIPLVQDGSYVHLRAGDKLLVGDVCGGMRSLIALLAFGVLMAYISKTRWWARILIVLVSPVVAVVANVARIFFLCLVGYFGGSQAATGLVHDASGIGIFAVAFALLFTVEAILRKVAPADVKVGAVSAAAAPPQTASAQGVALMFTVYGVMLALLGATAVIHWTINLRRDAATEMASFNPDLSLPSEIDSGKSWIPPQF